MKKCPFCESEKVSVEQMGKYTARLKCRGCGIAWLQKTKRYSVEWLIGSMTEAWNTRPIEEAQAARIDELENTLKDLRAGLEKAIEELDDYDEVRAYTTLSALLRANNE